MQNINLIFQGNEEIIKIVNSGDSIVKILGYPSNDKCPLIGAEIKLQNRVGKGAFGKVYLITIPGMGTKKYVIKRGNVEFDAQRMKLDDVITFLKDKNLSWDDVKPLQTQKNIDRFENGMGNDVMTFIFPANLCLISDYPETFTRIPQGKTLTKTTVPTGSYLCDTNVYSEYVIGVYMGKLYRDRVCINFFDVYSMFTCLNNKKNPNNFFQYIIMDKIDGDLSSCQRCADSQLFVGKNPFDLIDSIYVQTLIAIACYQKKYQISHNDLHTGNVFLEYVTKDTEFNGQKLFDAQWFHYIVNGQNIYLPATDVIVKIGDFGLSVKYSTPIIGDKYVFETGYDQGDGNGPWIPNIYMQAYDSLYFSASYARLLDGRGSTTKTGELIKNCVAFMCPQAFKNVDLTQNVNLLQILEKKSMTQSSNGRPVLDNLHIVRTAPEVIAGPIYNTYGKTPMSMTDKIVFLGQI